MHQLLSWFPQRLESEMWYLQEYITTELRTISLHWYSIQRQKFSQSKASTYIWSPQVHAVKPDPLTTPPLYPFVVGILVHYKLGMDFFFWRWQQWWGGLLGNFLESDVFLSLCMTFLGAGNSMCKTFFFQSNTGPRRYRALAQIFFLWLPPAQSFFSAGFVLQELLSPSPKIYALSICQANWYQTILLESGGYPHSLLNNTRIIFNKRSYCRWCLTWELVVQSFIDYWHNVSKQTDKLQTWSGQQIQ